MKWIAVYFILFLRHGGFRSPARLYASMLELFFITEVFKGFIAKIGEKELKILQHPHLVLRYVDCISYRHHELLLNKCGTGVPVAQYGVMHAVGHI